MKDIDKIFSKFNDLRVMVIGDMMVDYYSWGESTRMSPEAPVPILTIDKKEYRLGGAANVVRNLKSLGAECTMCSVIGDDEYGHIIYELLEESGINHHGIFKSKNRKTTLKQRAYIAGKQVLRIDDEDKSPLSETEDEALMDIIGRNINNVDAVVVADYDKGVLNKKNIKDIISLAKKNGKIVTVDPKEDNFMEYKNVDLFKPNNIELSLGLNQDIDVDDNIGLHASTEKLKKILSIENVLLTLADKGVYINFGKINQHIAINKTQVADVSGAGDTVLAIASLLYMLNVEPVLLGRITNLAGGLVCGKVGVACIDKNELNKKAKCLK